MSLSPYEEVRALVMTMVSSERANGATTTADSIGMKIDGTLQLYAPMRGQDFVSQVDRDALQRDIESSFNVFIAKGNIMSDDDDHEPWLDQRRSELSWDFWQRYRKDQLTVGKMPPEAVDRLDDITDMVLGRLESPDRPGSWDRRGLVAGQVQSGKTGNYVGLICKAIDAGYKLIVVLAGIHNSLRAQTQERVDHGVLGFSTEQALRWDADGIKLVGVGHQGFLHVHSFTSRKQNGDFNLSVANHIGVAVGGPTPVVLVVKKNKSVLTNILKWSTSLNSVVDPSKDRTVVQNVPLLVIDDEADQASVDTNGPRFGQESDPDADGKMAADEYDPPVINGLVRELLDRFQQSAYVGYTATPFANIFIDPEVKHKRAGESLFPRSFIISLPAPSTYIGPTRVFGLKQDVSRNLEPLDPLPMVRKVADYEEWMPDKHKKDHVPGPMPESLRQAVMAFVLTCAARRWRGQIGKHNSMLIHVTRFTDVQRRVRDQVVEELGRIKTRLRNADRHNDQVWLDLRSLFEQDYRTTAAEFATVDDVADQIGPMPTWEELATVLPAAAASIDVNLVNGTVKDALEYADHPDGIDVIAVGGAKLSRGLTLEGLSISYYLAGSRMYDTLMQMGRWFGYRPGYLDLCRLYTTSELSRRYRLITEASEELYREFDYMVALGSSPREFGLRVQQHPDGLMVTAPSHMKTARLVSMSFAGNLSETVLFHTKPEARERNWQALEELVRAMPAAAPASELKAMSAGQSFVWRGIGADAIKAFLSSYYSHEDAIKVQSKALRDYIAARTSDDPPELTDWWVLLANNSTVKDEDKVDVGGLRVGLTKRALHPEQTDSTDLTRFPIRRLVSPPHERIDIIPGTPEYELAVDTTARMWADSPRKDFREKDAPTEPAGMACRRIRPASRGILLLYPLDPREARAGSREGDPFVGFAISFPGSQKAKSVDYMVTVDAWNRWMGPRQDEDEDDVA
jgi:hypothetical protein